MPRTDDSTALPRCLRSGLRAAALHLKQGQARGHVSPTLWSGTPGQEHDPWRTASFPDPSGPGRGSPDAGLRLEVALALAHLVTPTVAAPHFWVTRSGEPELWTSDHAWLAAVWSACGELDLPTSFAVVTRTGWLHVPSGCTHRWKRLRA
ncbi:hypothetical protein IEQ44_00640 [Nocardioides sp. Y6]|uniref:Uncharacterized protein n=1 Tax=Nocardioides malaquae TaxID=2773426 RepID=A0ABR9RNL3_9ACTN|nr:hypothetical protein [Nocardioides malaquae]MBE7323157.1 hypothetical protein [Nocardioides malaquae]